MLYLIWTEELVFTTRAAGRDVDSREDPLLGKRAIELDFAVSSALEFLENDVIHAGAGLDEGGGDDGERSSAVLWSNRAGRPEESLWPRHGRRIEAAREGTA